MIEFLFLGVYYATLPYLVLIFVIAEALNRKNPRVKMPLLKCMGISTLLGLTIAFVAVFFAPAIFGSGEKGMGGVIIAVFAVAGIPLPGLLAGVAYALLGTTLVEWNRQRLRGRSSFPNQAL